MKRYQTTADCSTSRGSQRLCFISTSDGVPVIGTASR